MFRILKRIAVSATLMVAAVGPPIGGGLVTNLLRFTINPITRTVTVQLVH